jgi:uncharacterized phage-associated protein
MANIFDVANFFIEAALSQEDYVTNMKLNKLLYFAQAWSLVKYDRPLFEEPIEAWNYGPVVSEIYKKYKSYGNKPIMSVDSDDYCDSLTETDQEVLIDVMLNYGKYTAFTLVNMSHVRGGPWDSTFNKQGEISKSLIRDYYKSTSLIEDSAMQLCGLDHVIPKRDEKGNALLPGNEFDDWD